MHCPNCGNIHSSNSRFCQHCGTDFSNLTQNPVCATPQPSRKRKRIGLILLVLLVVLAGGVFFGLNYAHQFTPAKAAESVLYLEIYDHDDNIIGNASGFLVNDGRTLVTNYHVIDGAYKIVALTASGDKQVEASTVLAYDEVADLAILRCDNEIEIPFLTLSDSNSAKQGDKVYAAGYPLGLANTLSDGIISSRYTEDGVELLQITAPISSGSSGGALLNNRSQVIGVICAYYEDGQNLNVAIASNEVTALLNSNTTETQLAETYFKDYPQLTIDGDYYVCVRYIPVSTREIAEQIYSDWISSTATESNLIEIMNEFAPGEDVGKLRFFLRGELVEEADEWCFYEYRRIGDVTIIEDSDTFFLIYYSDAIKAGNLISTTTGRIFVSTLRDKWKNNSISREEFETKLKQLYSQHIEISEDNAIPHSSDPKQALADWKKKYGFE